MAAEILSRYGITPLIVAEAAPTPAISYAVIHEKADGALNFTASHNPPEYNGIKYSTPDGAPALPEATKQIEAAVNRIVDSGSKIPKAEAPAGGWETTNVKKAFLNRLAALVDLNPISTTP